MEDYLVRAQHYRDLATHMRALAADEENEDARRALKSIAATYDQLAHKFIALAQPKPTGEVIKFKL